MYRDNILYRRKYRIPSKPTPADETTRLCTVKAKILHLGGSPIQKSDMLSISDIFVVFFSVSMIML
jgi:hypothetical protein